MSDGEEELRSALMSAILRGMRDFDPARVHEIPDLTGLPEIMLEEIGAGRGDRVTMWALTKSATALGYDIEIRTMLGEGRVTIKEG